MALIEEYPTLGHEKFLKIWIELFDVNAKVFLRAIHSVWDPWFVLSTNWCRVAKKEALIEILNRSGLDFVVENLHSSWATPRRMNPDIRAGEIRSWHRANPGFENDWVILDDELSGSGLTDWPISSEQPFIVLCKENAGLTDVEYKKLRTAFQLRANSHLSNHRPD
jgi:hypothetical protein